MSGKLIQRLAAVAVVTTLATASSLAASPLRQADGDRDVISNVLFELLPAKVRVWVEGRDRQPARPPRARPRMLKCGGGLDPNGQPCH